MRVTHCQEKVRLLFIEVFAVLGVKEEFGVYRGLETLIKQFGSPNSSQKDMDMNLRTRQFINARWTNPWCWLIAKIEKNLSLYVGYPVI